MMLHSEFRDGNVPAGYEHKLLHYCEMKENKRFGRIEFAISCDVTREFKAAVESVDEQEWHPLYKEDFGGGKMPSSEFGANAAWWAVVVLAMNLASAMNRVVLGDIWTNRRMKAIRFLLINVSGRMVKVAIPTIE